MAALQDFRLIQRLGEGAAGEVHLATPRVAMSYAAPGDPLALKTYKRPLLEQRGQLERIRREFAVGSTLAHPNLVRMLDYALDGTSSDPFLVMEYVDGITLLAWTHMFRPLPGSIVFKVCRQVADAMAMMHENGLQHRDVKPANIMVSNTLDAKLMDLGVVRVTGDSILQFGDSSLTPEGVTLGTVRNSAPEMLFGENYDARVDVYSLGTVLYCLLHGEEVFHTEQQWARLTRMVQDDDPIFDSGLCGRDQICHELGRIAQTLLAKAPGDRPADAGEVLELLDDRVAPLLRERADEPVIHGYVATALTGLNKDVAEAMAFMSSSIAEVAKTYGIYVYQPRRFTDPLLHADVDPIIVYLSDRRRVSSSDLLFVVANRPSFGVGQEVEIAASLGKPTILIARNGTTISRMITGSFAHVIETIMYDAPEDLERKLRACLRSNAEAIRSWAVANRRLPDYKLGESVAARRVELGYAAAADFASATNLSVRLVNALEAGDYENIGLELLGRVARALDLDLGRLIASPGSAARSPARDSDRNLRELESLAKSVDMRAIDFLRLRDEYQREVAASGSSPVIDKREWGRRLQAIERRRLADAGADEPPEDGQSRLL